MFAAHSDSLRAYGGRSSHQRQRDFDAISATSASEPRREWFRNGSPHTPESTRHAARRPCRTHTHPSTRDPYASALLGRPQGPRVTRHTSSNGAPRGLQAPKRPGAPRHGCVLWLPSGIRWTSQLKRGPFSALTKRHQRHVTFHDHPRPFEIKNMTKALCHVTNMKQVPSLASQ